MQDGTHVSRYAYYAVDGQLGTVQTKPDCTQTRLIGILQKADPWWWVDLGSQNVVYSVRLLNIDEAGTYMNRGFIMQMSILAIVLIADFSKT